MSVGKCKECGGEALTKLCSFCSGGRKRVPNTFLTSEEYKARLVASAQASERLMDAVQKETKGPGEAVFACLMLALGIVETNPALPPLEWYVARLLELEKPGMQ